MGSEMCIRDRSAPSHRCRVWCLVFMQARSPARARNIFFPGEVPFFRSVFHSKFTSCTNLERAPPLWKTEFWVYKFSIATANPHRSFLALNQFAGLTLRGNRCVDVAPRRIRVALCPTRLPHQTLRRLLVYIYYDFKLFHLGFPE